MIKIIDIDALFDKYISDYVYENIGKVKPEEIENKIPELYIKFGDEKIKELDEETPNAYYCKYAAKELLECLRGHLTEGVSVSDFLCEAITAAEEGEKAIIDSLSDDANEEFTLYLLNMLSGMDCIKAKEKLLEFVLWDYSESIRELATELLSTISDEVKEEIIAQFKEVSDNKKPNLVEILAGCSKDDRVFEILINEFINNPQNVPLYAGYVAKYGDERALPFLKMAISNKKLPYADFEELRFAIEALGGEYNEERDFSKDKTFTKIMSSKEINEH